MLGPSPFFVAAPPLGGVAGGNVDACGVSVVVPPASLGQVVPLLGVAGAGGAVGHVFGVSLLGHAGIFVFDIIGGL